MGNTASGDHWRHLASALGLPIPPEPETPQEADSAGQTGAAELPVEGGPGIELEAPGGSPPVADALAAEALPPVAPPCATPSKLAAPPPRISRRQPQSHWFDVAGSLGVAVPEPEPEELEPEQPQPVEAKAAADLPPAAGDQHDQADDLTDDLAEVKETWKPPRPPAMNEGVARAVSLFEDPGLRLDSPGVLDRIFDEEADFEPRETAAPFASQREEPSWPDTETGEEPVSVEEAESGADEEPRLEDSGDDSDEEAGRATRRRRRRKRRPVRREEGTAGEVHEEVHEEVYEEVHEEVHEDADREVDAASETEAPEVEARSADDEEDEEDEDDSLGLDADDDETDQDGDRERAKHRKIPTWMEAIDHIISANLESRSRSGGGSRGRYRRGGRR